MLFFSRYKMVKFLQSFSKRWKQYKYRFVPWIALNFRKRKLRAVDGGANDKIIPDSQVEQSLLIFFTGLNKKDGSASDETLDPKGQRSGGQTFVTKGHGQDFSEAGNRKQPFVSSHSAMPQKTSCNEGKSQMALFTERKTSSGLQLWQNLDRQITEQMQALYSSLKFLSRNGFTPHARQAGKLALLERFPEQHLKQFHSGGSVFNLEQNSRRSSCPSSSAALCEMRNGTNHDHTSEDSRLVSDGLRVMNEILGFTIERGPSTIPGGGRGVLVTRGVIPARTAVAIYPGTVYKSWEPILLQSLANLFIFRCLDGTLIDGNDKGLSRMVYRSCAQRDRVGPYLTSDLSWLTSSPSNPMAVGQYVNNQNQDNPANVAYQEFDVPQSFPFHLLKYLPNVFYSSTYQQDTALSERLMRTVVLVSLRQIDCGEELFSSYFTIVH